MDRDTCRCSLGTWEPSWPPALVDGLVPQGEAGVGQPAWGGPGSLRWAPELVLTLPSSEHRCYSSSSLRRALLSPGPRPESVLGKGWWPQSLEDHREGAQPPKAVPAACTPTAAKPLCLRPPTRGLVHLHCPPPPSSWQSEGLHHASVAPSHW